MRALLASVFIGISSLSVGYGQTSIWLPTIERTPTHVTYSYKVQSPDFFADWIQNFPRPNSGMAEQKTIDGKDYTFIKRHLSWDTKGSNPAKTGQIRFDHTGEYRDGDWPKTRHDDFKKAADLIKALDSAGKPTGSPWVNAEILALKWEGSTPPQLTFTEEIPALEQAKARLVEIAKKTQPGKYYPNVQVPVDLKGYREAMLDIVNLGRRDPNYRKKNTRASDLGADYAKTDLGNEKIYHHSQTPPYFRDLKLDDRLNETAQFQAEWAAQEKVKGRDVKHDGPRSYNGVNMFDLGDRQKYFAPSYGSIVEAGGGATAPESWMKSETHYRPWFNIHHDVSFVGFGVAGETAILQVYGVAVGTKPHTADEQSESYTFQLPLDSGKELEREKKYPSRDGRQYLIWNKDGNLQIFYYRDPQPRREQDEWVWGLGSNHKISPYEIKSVRMSASGQLVAYGDKDKVLWTAANSKPSLGGTDVSQDPVVYGAGGAAEATQTPPVATTPAPSAPAVAVTPPPATPATTTDTFTRPTRSRSPRVRSWSRVKNIRHPTANFTWCYRTIKISWSTA